MSAENYQNLKFVLNEYENEEPKMMNMLLLKN